MELRKLISLGKSSYVISIPRRWAEKNKLRKGSTISLTEDNDQLVLQAMPKEKKEENKELTISIDGKNNEQLQQEIILAYINNHKTIILTGDETKKRAKEIKEMLHELVALEIMEQYPTRIVAKDFLDMEEISIKELSRKIDIIIREMLADTKKIPKEDLYEQIAHRDKDVNRLSFLLFRAVEYALINPPFIRKHNLTLKRILSINKQIDYMENIADDIKRVASYFNKISKKNKAIKEIKQVFSQIAEMYLLILKAYYKNNPQLAYKEVAERKKMIRKCNTFYNKYPTNKWVCLTTERLKSMINNICYIAKLICS